MNLNGRVYTAPRSEGTSFGVSRWLQDVVFVGGLGLGGVALRAYRLWDFEFRALGHFRALGFRG